MQTVQEICLRNRYREHVFVESSQSLYFIYITYRSKLSKLLFRKTREFIQELL